MEQVTALLYYIDAISVLYNCSKATWEHLNKFNIKEPKRLVLVYKKVFKTWLAPSLTGNAICKRTAAFTSQSSLQLNSCPHAQSIKINYSRYSQDLDPLPGLARRQEQEHQLKAVAFKQPALPEEQRPQSSTRRVRQQCTATVPACAWGSGVANADSWKTAAIPAARPLARGHVPPVSSGVPQAKFLSQHTQLLKQEATKYYQVYRKLFGIVGMEAAPPEWLRNVLMKIVYE